MPVTLRRVASAKKRQQAQTKKSAARPDDAVRFKQVARNRRARHEYDILETFECGIALQGAEVKSLRLGRVTIADAYARVEARRGMAPLHAHPPVRRTPPDSVPLTLTDDGSFSSIDPRSTSCSHAPNNKR